MSLERARAHLARWNRQNDIIEFDVSSATVELASKALNTDEGRIAKSLSFKTGDGALLVVTAGNTRIDSRKFRDEFKTKPVMLPPGQVEALIGHDIGGVCPFGVREGVEVYLDVSLKNHDPIYPACGSANSAIKMTAAELEETSQAKRWVDVSKPKEGPI